MPDSVVTASMLPLDNPLHEEPERPAEEQVAELNAILLGAAAGAGDPLASLTPQHEDRLVALAWHDLVALDRLERSVRAKRREVGRSQAEANRFSLAAYRRQARQQHTELERDRNRRQHMARRNLRLANGNRGEVRRPESQADRLIGLVDPAMLIVGVDESCSPRDLETGRVFIALQEEGCRKLHALRSPRIRRWLRLRYCEAHDSSPNDEALKQAIDTLEARGFAPGTPRYPVYWRIARIDGTIWIDLCDECWRAVKVTRDGWEVVVAPPVFFARFEAAESLPDPVRSSPIAGGSLLEDPEESRRRGRLEALAPLRTLLNLGDGPEGQDRFVLILAWMLMALGGRGDYPVLVLNGEHGGGKSTAMSILRSLCDPHKADRRGQPKDAEVVRTAAANSFILSFDNLSHLPGWLSDMLCLFSTGGFDSRRGLYTDLAEITVRLKAPLMLNGIPEFVQRPDLTDRCVFVTLPPIVPGRRLTKRDLQQRVQAMRPAAFGALLDGLVEGLLREGAAPLERPPRMSDFAQFGSDCETAFWLPGTFIEIYERNCAGANAAMLEADALATVLSRWLRHLESRRWEGTATELLQALSNEADDLEKSQRDWPRAANALSGRLRRAAPVLRAEGIEVSWPSAPGNRRRIVIACSPHAEPQSSVLDGSAPANGPPRDDPNDPGPEEAW